MKRTLMLWTVCLIVLAGVAIAKSASMYFTENKGQWEESVKFRCDAGDAVVWICKDRIVYQFLQSVEQPGRADQSGSFAHENGALGADRVKTVEQLVVTAKFVDANPNAQATGKSPSEFRYNYFLGSDGSRWQTDVRNFQSIRMLDVYPGVDLNFFADSEGRFTYQYDLAEESVGKQVKIEYEGIETASKNQSGRFVAATRLGEIAGLIADPTVAKSSSLKRNSIFDSPASPPEDVSESALRSPQAVSLIYSTFLGGSDMDYSWDMAVDKNGNIYIAGHTYSGDFPHPNAYDSTFDGGFGDVIVAKLSADGQTLVYGTYLGGSHIEASQCIAVDSIGQAFVAGSTSSTDFPTQNAYDATVAGQDAFVTKLSANGNALIYSTLLGGDSYETPFSIVTDKFGSAYVTGETFSTDFPKVNAFDAVLGGSRDVFVTKFSPSGTALTYSTYLGGTDNDVARCIAVDGSGAAYVTGQTNSFNYPTQNAYDATAGGFGEDAFVTKLSAAGNTLVYSTYLGGSNDDWGYGIAVDGLGNAYVTGGTYSSNFPRLNAFDSTQAGSSEDVFVTKFSSAGNTLGYSTYLGGTSSDRGVDIEVDGSGSAYVSGYTSSSNFPTKDAYDSTANGSLDAFVTKLATAGNALVYSTYLGGVNHDTGIELELDASNNVYLSGNTGSPNFPHVNAVDTSLSGFQDGYIAKLSVGGGALVGDCSGDGRIDISDAVFLINHIFAGGPAPTLQVGDGDCNGRVDIGDAVNLINYIFAAGSAPGTGCR